MIKRKAPNRQQIAQVESVPAPTGGLNARDAYAEMPPTDALVMDNMFPTPSYVAVRNGSLQWVLGMPVSTLACYSQASGARHLFAAANGNIYDVTASGALGAAQVTGNTTDRWQYVNFGAGGGQYLIMVNGQDYMQAYNGTGWQTVGNGTGAVISSASAVTTTATVTTATPHGLATGNTITVIGATPAAYNVTNAVITVTSSTTFTYTMLSAPGGVMTVIGTYTYSPSITGVATNTLINVSAFQGRLFFIQKNSMKAWYLPLLSVGGAAQYLDLSSQTTLGGYLVAMATWTIETATSMVELGCFITSEGEVLVYQGNDPSFASSWYKLGTFRIGRPIGYKCTVRIGSDVACITADGLVPLSKALVSNRSENAIAISDKIQNLINTDVQSYATQVGWQAILHPIGNKLIMNVPAPISAYQYVQNTVNNSWCKFTGWNATCFELVGDQLFYGCANGVYLCDYLNSDNGANINAVCIQAPSYFGSHAEKQFTMARPVMTSNGPVKPSFQINTDFNLSAPTNQIYFSSAAFTFWGAPWYSNWSTINQVFKNWVSVNGTGYAGSPALAIAVNGATVSWQATDIAYLPGGVL